MASFRAHTLGELLNFTVNDIRGISTLDVKDWSHLSPDNREQVFKKLRDETVQTVSIDPNQLEGKLNQLPPERRSSSSSSSSHFRTPSPTRLHEWGREKNRNAYYSLIEEGGIPSHPVDLGVSVLEEPGEYKDIASYWERQISGSAAFCAQLQLWRKFRGYQQRMRRYFIQRDRFPEYQQSVSARRRRHGLEGDVDLREEVNQQSKMENWVEYQDYLYIGLENLGKTIEENRGRVEATQMALVEAGLPRFEDVYAPGNYTNGFVNASVFGTESWDEENKVAMERLNLKWDLDLAQKRLKAARSDQFGETVERTAWIRLAEEEVGSAWKQQDRVPPKPKTLDTRPEPRPRGWTKDDWDEELTKRNEELMNDPVRWDAELKRREAEMAPLRLEWRAYHQADHKAWVELRFAEKLLRAAHADDFGDWIEKATWIALIQKNLEDVRKRLDETTEVLKRIRLRVEVRIQKGFGTAKALGGMDGTATSDDGFGGPGIRSRREDAQELGSGLEIPVECTQKSLNIRSYGSREEATPSTTISRSSRLVKSF
ncbi:MAG: hypothetical protein M1817_003891 [Caeruleum heppii]|nr:MAG: hypothetical protein M1817_003891 [Caeruleum heppii]